MSVPADRLPPQNVEAEQSVLGSLLLDREAVASVMEILSPEDFYLDVHQLIYRAIIHLYDLNKPIDVVTLAEELRRDGQLERVGGATYLATLARFVPTAASARHYAEIVESKSVLRHLIQAGTTMAGRAYDATEEPRSLLDQAEQMVFEIAQHRIRKPYASLSTLLARAYERLEQAYETPAHVTGVSTGFKELDEITSGLQPSDLIILAGRPSQGKTTLALNVARNAARLGSPVGLFSLEMSAEQLALRFLSAEVPIDAQLLRAGPLGDKDFARIADALGRLGDTPIFIDDSPSLSALELRTRARRMKRDKNVALFIIDYLQLMRGHTRTDSRQQEISEISRALKALARELETPIVALSQLSRAVETRTDRRPQLSDLRESGAIEQDADVVAFIHYPPDDAAFWDWKGCRYQLGENGRALQRVSFDGKGTTNWTIPYGVDFVELIIGKQRNGPTGSVCLTFNKKIGRFATPEIGRDAPPGAD